MGAADMEDDEHDHGDAESVARPWSWMHMAAVAANLAANMSHSLWAFFDDIKDAAKAHVAVSDDERDAWASLHRDLESLPTAEK